MPLSTLDSVAALVVIDLQKGIVGTPTAHPTAQIVENSALLARAFRKRGLPVVLVNVDAGAPGRVDAPPNFKPTPGWSDLVSELDQQPTDYLVTKKRWGAFMGTSLDQYLRDRKATQIVLTGIATSAGVESTARSAHELGYNVVLVEDAMTDRVVDAHENSIKRIFPRLGEVTTTKAMLAALDKKTSS
jgi:nicotinamidase-related amidase